jgi:hypothetical protein
LIGKAVSGVSAIRLRLASQAAPAFLPVRWAALLLALLLVVLGQRMLTHGVPLALALGCWAAGLTVLVLMQRRALPAADEQPEARRQEVRRLRLPQRGLLALALGCALAIWFRARGRPETDSFLDIAILWLLSMSAALVAAAWPSAGWHAGLRSGAHRFLTGLAQRDWLPIAGVVAIALILRTVVLGRFPSIVNPDGGALAMVAVDVKNGTLANPFTTGWYDNPTLYAFLQAGSMRVFGDSLAGVRVPSALLGAAAVLFTWLLTRRLLGRRTALIAAVVLAVFHYHLYFSRVALNNVADSFFLVAMLYWLDRGLVERRRLDCLLAGLAIGLGQYFYFGARLLPAVAIVYGLFLALRCRRQAATARAEAWQVARLGAWVAGGAVLAYLPLLAHYLDQPWDFTAAFDRVSILRPGWLEQQRALTGMSSAEILARQARDAILLPFGTAPHGYHYYPGPPLIGVPMAVLAAIGLAIATVGALQRRYAALAISWWGAIGAVAFTEEVQTQRFIVAAPLVAVFCAIALEALWRILTRQLGVARVPAIAAVAGAVLFLTFWNIHFFFRESNQLRIYGDINSLIATRLGNYLREHGPHTVYFAGAPRMLYGGFPILPFLARDSTGVDLDQPLTDKGNVPAARGPTLFVFLPERVRELKWVRARYPNGLLRRLRAPTGEPLLTSYEVSGQRRTG